MRPKTQLVKTVADIIKRVITIIHNLVVVAITPQVFFGKKDICFGGGAFVGVTVTDIYDCAGFGVLASKFRDSLPFADTAAVMAGAVKRKFHLNPAIDNATDIGNERQVVHFVARQDVTDIEIESVRNND